MGLAVPTYMYISQNELRLMNLVTSQNTYRSKNRVQSAKHIEIAASQCMCTMGSAVHCNQYTVVHSCFFIQPMYTKVL